MVPENDQNLTIELNRINAEIAALIPFEYAPGIKIKIEPILGSADGKTENKKKGNDSQKQCPKCGKLPKDYKGLPQVRPLKNLLKYIPT